MCIKIDKAEQKLNTSSFLNGLVTMRVLLLIFQYVTIRVHPDQMMCHGGSTEPCASVELHSIGNIGPSVNKQLAKDVAEYIQQHLGIKGDRYVRAEWNLYFFLKY